MNSCWRWCRPKCFLATKQITGREEDVWQNVLSTFDRRYGLTRTVQWSILSRFIDFMAKVIDFMAYNIFKELNVRRDLIIFGRPIMKSVKQYFSESIN